MRYIDPPQEALIGLMRWHRWGPPHRKKENKLLLLGFDPEAPAHQWWDVGFEAVSLKTDFELTFPKPGPKRLGDESEITNRIVTSEEFFLMLVLGVANGRVGISASKGGQYHYLTVKLPQLPAINFNRLVADASQQDISLLGENFRDMRPESLGPLVSTEQQQEVHGKSKVSRRPRIDRNAVATAATRSYADTNIAYLLPPERYKLILADAFRWIDATRVDVAA